jgi:hypothetical protein
MLKSFKQLDNILRGQATQLPSLQQGQIEIPLKGLSIVLLVLGLVYGVCMGSYAMMHGNEGKFMQLTASTVKFPLLFFLTLVITFPSLYVFNALIGSRLSILSALRLLVASLGVMLAVVASLGPIVIFFAASTSSYPFMILLNVAVCGVSGILGLSFLLRTLHRLVIIQEDKNIDLHGPPASTQPIESGYKFLDKESRYDTDDTDVPHVPIDLDDPKGPVNMPRKPIPPYSALDRIGSFTSIKAKSVFRIWLLVFALVGAQMSWVLRPFVGNPASPFEWFREQDSNFFQAVLKTFFSLFTG